LTLIEPVVRKKFDEILLVDFPGYNGLLAREAFFHSLDLLMDGVFDILDSLKPDTVMGHSLGGFLSAHYAAACSTGVRITGRKQSHSMLKSIIAVDPSGVFESDLDRKEWELKIRKLAAPDHNEWRPYIFAREPFWFKYLGEHFLRFGAREEIATLMESAREEHEVQRILPQIQTEVSLVWGEKDTLIPASFASSWLKYLSQAKGTPRAAVIKGVGHSPQVEAPAILAAVVGQMLSGRVPHSAGSRWYRVLDPSLI
jgi:pimeloyl-ACP methyl ester carboxylesterase